jgi:hypothetical protein
VGYVECARIQHSQHFGIYLHWRTREFPAIDTQENIGSRKRHPFVAIHEGVVHGDALHEGCGLRYKISVVAGLRSKKCTFQRPSVTKTGPTSMALDKDSVDCESILNR